MPSPRRHIRVSCAVIERDGRVLAARRSGAMSMPFKWEFPGGKIREGESPSACLVRELAEEMDIVIAVQAPLPITTHQYPSFSITLYPFVCSLRSGEITLHEHAEAAWLSPDELFSLDWAEADGPVLEAYLESLRTGRNRPSDKEAL
jgi:8-oxo-dGTP diphosphatase